ncbi:unnamed protein product [Rotaria sp. Silwood2]|nr:unnamed protein product [Rotaria sp. Silwood2]CAF3174246.1 unnamed protein product [Rotaria sp. Silwood2]CAF3387296.1 unnamed protein product [Rotaria sp. Silwood2]CAF3537955.1 unnamed protein product [Rotaria sp. Silwood2]CAF4538565.1 unnamed protein product [Rotaria sp. Silwood2]
MTQLAISPFVIVATLAFTALFISLTLLPIHLHETPYNYTETTIGTLFVPGGIGMLIGSLIGGWLSDKAMKYYGDVICPEGCLVPGLTFPILSSIGLIIYGWTFHYRLHVIGPIIGQILIGLGYSVLAPGVSAYLTVKKQEQAATVSSLNGFFDSFSSSIFVTAAVPLEKAMNTGYLFSLICGINFVAIVLVSILVYKGIRRAKLSVMPENGIGSGSESCPDRPISP